MGRYIETGCNFAKAEIIAREAPGEIVARPAKFSDIPPGKALICVVDNGPFEAAGYCYNEREFLAFTEPDDPRRKRWVLIDKDTAEKLAQ